MTLLASISDTVPGLLRVALLFGARTPSGGTASVALLADGDTEKLIDLGQGLDPDAPGLTRAMQSYLSGLKEVGAYLEARHKTDEDGVTEDDIERAALMLAFPRVTRDEAALTLLKAHLDALQAEGILPRLKTAPGAGTEPTTPAPAPAAAPAPLSLAGSEAAPEAPADATPAEDSAPEEGKAEDTAPEAAADETDTAASESGATDTAGDDSAADAGPDEGTSAPTPDTPRPLNPITQIRQQAEQPRRPGLFGR